VDNNLPTNIEAENGLLACAMVNADATLAICKQLGLTANQISGPAQKKLYKGMLQLSEGGKTVDRVMLNNLATGMGKFMETLLDAPSSYTTEAARDYALVVIEHALARDVITAARAQATPLYKMKESVVDTARRLRDEMDNVLLAHSRTEQQEMENPADALARETGWSVQIGIPWFDERLRLPSGALHGLAADPNMGKSSTSIQSAGYNARAGIPCALFVAEDDVLDVQLTLLSQLEGKVDMVFVNRIRFDPSFKTESNLDVVRQMWDEHYKDTPLVIMAIPDGPDAIVSAIDALQGPHYVIVDHAYAVVGQSTKKIEKDYQEYRSFYTALRSSARRHNHIILVLNQYKVLERGKSNRVLDAQFGGSGVANILHTAVHMWKPEGDFTSSPSGWQAVTVECVKVKARMVIDESTGLTKDPMDGEGTIYIQYKHRLVGDPSRPIYLP
jgi:hypothetical protein